jgi:hypothetical protein
MPDLEQFRQQSQRSSLFFGIYAVFVAMLSGIVYVGAKETTFLYPGLIFLVCYLPPILWRWPRVALYGIYASVCLFEVFPTHFKQDGLTDYVPFFWNINTMFEIFTTSKARVAPINFLELIFIIMAAIALLRLVFQKGTKLTLGPLFVPILIYLCFVGVGWLNGMVGHGNFTEALQEVRAQVYFLVAYVMAVNLVRDPRQVLGLFWTSAILIVFKACIYIYFRYAIYHGEIPDQGVGSHEESFFFMTLVMQLFVLKSAEILPRLRMFLWATLPIVLFGNICTNRRAAYAAVMVAAIVLMMTVWRAWPKKRVGILWLIGIVALVGPPYFLAFRHSEGPHASLARAIQSKIEPNERDRLSNLYRDIENYDLMATMHSSPLTSVIGYGYGKRFLTPVKPADISEQYAWWNLLPHNQIYWVWMRTGTLGFLAFWAMVCLILVYACRIVRRFDLDPVRRATALMTLILLTMLLFFGLLDLQLSNFRDMLFVGMWIGAMARLTPDGFTHTETIESVRKPRRGVRARRGARGR